MLKSGIALVLGLGVVAGGAWIATTVDPSSNLRTLGVALVFIGLACVAGAVLERFEDRDAGRARLARSGR